jgi:hypothetical protein
VGEESVALKDEADVPLAGQEARHVLAADQDAPGIGLLEACDHAQGGGFAAAGRAEESEELGGAHLEAHFTDGVHLALHAMVEALGHALQPDGHGASSCAGRVSQRGCS